MAFPDELGTERLLLRSWRDADREQLAAVWAEEEVWSSLQPGRPFDRTLVDARIDHHIRHWLEHGFGLWAATERSSGETVGWFGPSHPDFAPDLSSAVEIGWTLRSAWWGRGLATEGAAAALDAAFGHLDPTRVVSMIHPSNERSIAVAGRLGMRHDGHARHRGLAEELRIYALGREAWAARR